MVCEYDWTLEMYATLGRACYHCPQNYTDCERENCILADGKLKSIEVVNKLLPGPSIQVCKGDTVVVNLVNMMRSERVTSIHWHGVKQNGTPDMDGVGMVTQWPVLPMLGFQYRFNAENTGTHFWHAHSGVQRSISLLSFEDGVFGAVIVREDKKNDPNGGLYDYDLKENYMIIIEWTLESFQGYYGPYLNSGYFDTEHNILINGKGAITESPEINVPLEVFTVKPGSRYRFRLVNAGIQFCIMSVSIDAHNLTLIASDGMPMEPVEVESLASTAGERYDFVVNANQEPRDYWIKVRGEGDCYYLGLSQRAILRYERADLSSNQLHSNMTYSYNDSLRHGLQFRSYPSEFSNEPIFLLSQAKYGSSDHDDYFKQISKQPDKKFLLNMDVVDVNDPEFLVQGLYNISQTVHHWGSSLINNIKFHMPSSPLLYNPNFNISNFCSSIQDPINCPDQEEDGFCECTHLLEVDLGDLVEIIVFDGAHFDEAHSAHLHGHNFAVIGIDKVSPYLEYESNFTLSAETIINMDSSGKLKRNFNRPPIKDTVALPLGGYAIIRFIADNPGFWMFHCHLDSHSDSGMMLVLKVGDSDDLPPKPSNWPYFN